MHVFYASNDAHPPMRLTMRSDINHFRFFSTGPSRFHDRRQCLPFSTESISILGDLLSPVSPSSSRVRIGTNTTPGRKDRTASSANCNRGPFGLGCLSERRRCTLPQSGLRKYILHVWFQPSDSARSPSPTRQPYSGFHPDPTEPQSTDSRGSRGS